VKVLISGVAGFIGSNLVKRLSTFAEVNAIDALSTGHLGGQEANFVESSTPDEKALNYAINGCDAVLHLVAQPLS
jgi:nucleoside-diphosphate-sugar epimerase